MEMHQIRYFLAVADELNFTRASERCNVTQPSLTRAIKMLEDELGGPLFNRERRRTHLTELGRMVQPHLREIHARTIDVKREAVDLVQLKRAVLKLGLMCTIAPAHLLELIRAVRGRHPGLELQLTDSTASELYERLHTGDLEIAVCCHPESEDDERLHRIPLFRERFVIVVSPAHKLARKDAICVRDVDGEDYLDRVHCEYADRADRIFKEQGVEDRTVYRSDRDDWILAMAAAGMGYAFMPEQSAHHPEVAVRPLIEPEIWREISLVTVRGRKHSTAVGVLVAEAIRWRRSRLSGPHSRVSLGPGQPGLGPMPAPVLVCDGCGA
jgi:LysR family transcriptional regulator, hydrogen peroxide-inducible genes activator